MNTNQVKGKAKEILGEAQKYAGRIVGSKSQEARGNAKEIEGKIQKKAGEIQQAVKEVDKNISIKN